MKSYVVIGLGRFGASLARQLCKLGAEVLALDVKGDLVQQVASEVTHAVVGDAQDKEVLRALGVRNMDCAIIAIGDNLAASVLIEFLQLFVGRNTDVDDVILNTAGTLAGYWLYGLFRVCLPEWTAKFQCSEKGDRASWTS